MCRNKAIVAVAREMLTIIYHMLSNKEEYRGNNEALTEKSIRGWHLISSRAAMS
jgi:hypothetical protein